jgi:hypothetical protein
MLGSGKRLATALKPSAYLTGSLTCARKINQRVLAFVVHSTRLPGFYATLFETQRQRT